MAQKATILTEATSKHSRILRQPAVTDRIGLSRTTIWRRIREGEFPVPVRLGKNAVGWLESDVENWIASLTKCSEV